MNLERLVGVLVLAGALPLCSIGLAAAQSNEETAGASLSGCQGSAVSVDKDGEERDTVSAPGGPGSSAGAPFHVVSDGSVNWAGSTDGVIKDFTWKVKLMGVTVKSGSAENDEERTADDGVEDVDQYLPFKITGLYHVDFDLSGDGGKCSGDLWVKLDGNPFGTVPWLIGAGLILAGGGVLWLGRPTTKAEPAPSTEEGGAP
jgi:hypothetical protein